MILVNGSEGIGTGFSTLIPTYDLIDVINWFKNKLLGKSVNELIQIILDETNLRCVKKEPLVVVEENKENNKNIKELSIYAEEFNPYKEGIHFDYKILEKIYYHFNNETDINGYSSIDLFCYNNNIKCTAFSPLG